MAEITDIRPGPRGSQRRRVYIDGDEWRAVPAGVVRDVGLEVGQTHHIPDLDGALLESEARLAWERALRLLDYRERSTEELRRRLADDGYREAVVADVVARATDLGFLADARFAEMLTRSLADVKLFGRTRVALELRRKGIDDAEIESVLATCCDPESESERASRLASRLVRGRPLDVRRLAARLTAKGYAADVAWRVAREACPEHSSDEGPDEPV